MEISTSERKLLIEKRKLQSLGFKGQYKVRVCPYQEDNKRGTNDENMKQL